MILATTLGCFTVTRAADGELRVAGSRDDLEGLLASSMVDCDVMFAGLDAPCYIAVSESELAIIMSVFVESVCYPSFTKAIAGTGQQDKLVVYEAMAKGLALVS